MGNGICGSDPSPPLPSSLLHAISSPKQVRGVSVCLPACLCACLCACGSCPLSIVLCPLSMHRLVNQHISIFSRTSSPRTYLLIRHGMVRPVRPVCVNACLPAYMSVCLRVDGPLLIIIHPSIHTHTQTHTHTQKHSLHRHTHTHRNIHLFPLSSCHLASKRQQTPHTMSERINCRLWKRESKFTHRGKQQAHTQKPLVGNNPTP
mmetsp:Transcript_53235/g.134051  ORF Transcript_53235/g.134051 Transcript_53235/m.134051 type:complete len:205 (+) Transcript_53235:274-888(+)